MSTILIHAGMPKTGSTSIQSWLRINAARLDEEHGKTLVIDHVSPEGEEGFAPYERGPFVAVSRFMLGFYNEMKNGADESRVAALGAAFAGGLCTAADRHGDIIVTSEAFAHPILETEVGMLRAFEAAAQSHDVRVVLYVRPQHDAIDARWRQWGYHSVPSPSAWWDTQVRSLHYHAQTEAASALAPSVQFELYPFRRDLLRDGDVVADFAHRELGVDGNESDLHDNPGLSLDLAILLFGAPPDVVRSPKQAATGFDFGRRQVTIAEVTADWELPASDQARAARAAIHRLAYAEFAADNRALVSDRGWAGGEFVPAPDEGDDVVPADLDRLLSPQLDPESLAYFHRAIADLCAAHETRAHD